MVIFGGGQSLWEIELGVVEVNCRTWTAPMDHRLPKVEVGLHNSPMNGHDLLSNMERANAIGRTSRADEGQWSPFPGLARRRRRQTGGLWGTWLVERSGCRGDWTLELGRMDKGFFLGMNGRDNDQGVEG